MSFRRLFVVALAMLVITGCAQDTTAPGEGRDADPQAGLPGAASAASTALYDDLSRLAQYIVPNPDAILTKFDALVAAFEAGTGFDYQLNDLIGKIDLEYGKYLSPPRNGDPELCVQTAGDCQFISDLYVDVIKAIYLYVGMLDAEDPTTKICVLPGGHAAGACEAPKDGNQGTGFVHFPAELFGKLTFVSVKNKGKGPLNNLDSGLDEYGYEVEIRTAPVAEFGSVRPTVVVCVPPADITPAILNRLAVGHRRSEDKPEYDGNPPFSLLPAADEAVAERAEKYCGEATNGGAGSSGPSVFGLSVDSPLNRLLVGAREFLLPAQLSASNAGLFNTRGFSGASGSPEEFSTFRAVDRGVTGAGGSPEEFAPQASGGSPATGYQGVVGTSATTGLPHVIVQTQDGLGVNGVRVTFEIIRTQAPDLQPPGGAQFCLENGSRPTSVTVVSGTTPVGNPIDGNATLPCIDFGDTPGFVNLRATFDPSQVFKDIDVSDQLQPCMIQETAKPGDPDRVGDCDTNDSVSKNFLIETLEPPVELSCDLVQGSRTNKLSLANYSGGVWSAYFESAPGLGGSVRQVTLFMSVTGQSNALTNFPVTLTAYRGSTGGDELAQGSYVFNTLENNIELPGDNGSYYPVTIGLIPTPGEVAGIGDKMVFKIEVTAPSNRTPQLWYRTDKFTDPKCLGAIVYANGLTPTAASSKDTKAGLGIIINNTVWP